MLLMLIWAAEGNAYIAVGPSEHEHVCHRVQRRALVGQLSSTVALSVMTKIIRARII